MDLLRRASSSARSTSRFSMSFTCPRPNPTRYWVSTAHRSCWLFRSSFLELYSIHLVLQAIPTRFDMEILFAVWTVELGELRRSSLVRTSPNSLGYTTLALNSTGSYHKLAGLLLQFLFLFIVTRREFDRILQLFVMWCHCGSAEQDPIALENRLRLQK